MYSEIGTYLLNNLGSKIPPPPEKNSVIFIDHGFGIESHLSYKNATVVCFVTKSYHCRPPLELILTVSRIFWRKLNPVRTGSIV